MAPRLKFDVLSLLTAPDTDQGELLEIALHSLTDTMVPSDWGVKRDGLCLLIGQVVHEPEQRGMGHVTVRITVDQRLELLDALRHPTELDQGGCVAAPRRGVGRFQGQGLPAISQRLAEVT